MILVLLLLSLLLLLSSDLSELVPLICCFALLGAFTAGTKD